MTVKSVKIINAHSDNFITYFKKIWEYKSLIWIFAIRDLKVKYSQTFLGLAWSIIQPLTALIMYTFFFGYLLRWKTDGLPFPIYVLSGLMGWNYFSYIIYQGSSSIQDAGNTIKKIYFPKSILPFSKVVVALVELLLSATLLIPLLIYYQINLSWKILALPLVIVFNTLCALLPVFWIAAFAYKKRDLFHLLPYFITFGIWLTPVFFAKNIFPNSIKYIIELNPIANVIEMWRWMLFNYGTFNYTWLVNGALVFLGCAVGMYFYNRNESHFSDYV
jgi:lipopolysaccharide transport system permease protein